MARKFPYLGKQKILCFFVRVKRATKAMNICILKAKTVAISAPFPGPKEKRRREEKEAIEIQRAS